MLARCGLALFAALAGGGIARADSGEWLPDGLLFPALPAATIEATDSAALTEFEAQGERSLSTGMIALGDEFALYRRRLGDGAAWQLGLFADIRAQFNMDVSNQPLLNTDFFVGLPLSWRRQAWSARLRVYHQSSHLGDELLLSGEAPPRQNLSYEATDVLLARELLPGWRLYGGGAWVMRKQWDALGDYAVQLGSDYLAPARNALRGHWLLALDCKWAQAFGETAQLNLLAGIRWGGETPGRGSFSLAAQFFHGAVPFGQFFDTSATFYGAALLFSQ